MMMLPEGWVTDIITSRPQALKALGNGVVPPQAAHAISALLPACTSACTTTTPTGTAVQPHAADRRIETVNITDGAL